MYYPVDRNPYVYVYKYKHAYTNKYLNKHVCLYMHTNAFINTYDDDVYLRLQHGKGFHGLVYTSYVKHIINPAKWHK
jgi:hypothetical protein